MTTHPNSFNSPDSKETHSFDDLYEINISRRQRNLNHIDNANFGLFHVRTCIIAGIGFFTDAYDLFVINFVSIMLSYTDSDYMSYNPFVRASIDMALKMSAACGTLIGQLVFGWCADRFGRKRMYGLELSIMIVATFGSAMSSGSFAITTWASLIFWRFILGIGIGVITSEFATVSKRGAMISAVFAMQGFGILTAGIVSVVTLGAYRESIVITDKYIDPVWRIILVFGAIPAILGFYFRVTIPETPRFTMDILGDIEKAERDINNVLKREDPLIQYNPICVIDGPGATWQDFKEYFSKWKNAKILLGTSLSWFVLDIAFYGIGLNNGIILQAIGFGYSQDTFSILWNLSVGNIIITMLGTIPGYWFTVFLVDKWGRKKIQLMGFMVLTGLFLIWGLCYSFVKQYMAIFITIFSLCQLFQNFGPNATTFIVPSEVFPTRYRSTGHGISAASGKLGAIIAQVGFLQLKDIGGSNKFVDRLILIFACFMFLGIFSTLLIPETRDKTLETLSNESPRIIVNRKHKRKASG
ncbi:phosphate transporter [Gigaspora margarita]|uniref:Phosphate transporter n=2 Tax=Gigaspora margarita TaxID=4874 RepID=A0A8H4B2M3_GIGMA|nr:phosphate transporter [Gigaspora margarita]